MKSWKEYKEYFSNGDWHMHTLFSDEKNTPEEMVKESLKLEMKLVAITDHVNRESDWLDEYVKEIEKLREKYEGKIKILSGIEAKVINLEGDIDAKPEFYEKVDLVLGAFHRIPTENGFMREEEIPQNKEKVLDYWKKAFLSLLRNENVDIIAHPGKLFQMHGIKIPVQIKEEVSKAAKSSGKIFEKNVKYDLPDKEFLELLTENGIKFVRGSDSHTIEELNKTSSKN